MEMIPVVQTPFEILAADIVGPLPITKRKNRYILTMMDLSTRYPEATPLKQATSTAILDAKNSFTEWVIQSRYLQIMAPILLQK